LSIKDAGRVGWKANRTCLTELAPPTEFAAAQIFRGPDHDHQITIRSNAESPPLQGRQKGQKEEAPQQRAI
jgi:hypothetical protein